jgi:LysM repeat protein
MLLPRFITVGVIMVFLLSPRPLLAANIFFSFQDRVKSIFLEKEEESKQEISSPQTMAVLKPVVVDESTTSQMIIENDSLRVDSGPLRVATEDIEFPQSDIISVYEVKKGDTISDVARLFDVSVNTILWANNLKSRTLTPGTTLIILPVTGIRHTVKKGDTVKSLAKLYRADTEDIAQYNGITEDSSLSLGQVIIIPDGEIEIIQPKIAKKKTTSKITRSYTQVTPSGFLIRPVQGGRRTQGIHGNNAVDIAATPGTAIVASGNGVVIAARIGGYNGGYGNMVIISHANGVQTLYAHMREVYVSSGETVTQGQVIGGVGNTGRSTGPHLHFEVRGAKNPF